MFDKDLFQKTKFIIEKISYEYLTNDAINTNHIVNI